MGLQFARGYLLVIGLLFYLPFGALLLVDPEAMFARIDILFASEMALEEVRASHGGVWLLTGLCCLVSVWRTQWISAVLSYLLILNGGFAIGRVISLVVGSVPTADLLPLFGFDLVLVVLSMVVLLRADLPRPS